MLTVSAGRCGPALRADGSEDVTAEADDERTVDGVVSGSDELEWAEEGESESVKLVDACRLLCVSCRADDGDVGAERMPFEPEAPEVAEAECAESGGANTARYGCWCAAGLLLLFVIDAVAAFVAGM